MNYKYILRGFMLMGLIPVSAALSSCHHKDLWLEENPSVNINVVYDWRFAPDAGPASMGLYLYRPLDSRSFRYLFQNNTGGPIRVPYGSYYAVGLNNDNRDWAYFNSAEDSERFSITTADSQVLPAAGILVESVPRTRDTENERMALTPGMLWSDRINDIDLPVNTKDKTITLYPEERICYYTVDIYDVKNIDSLHGAGVDATLSGLAEGFFVGKEKASEVPVTMPFALTRSAGGTSLHGDFLTFGEPEGNAVKHIMTLYMLIKDGSKWCQAYDVSSQVTDAPDKKHVHIVVNGLDLPQPISGSSGLNPDVNDWEAVHINLRM